MTPEELARFEMDKRLNAAGWVIQDPSAMNLYAAKGVAVREFTIPGHGKQRRSTPPSGVLWRCQRAASTVRGPHYFI